MIFIVFVRALGKSVLGCGKDRLHKRIVVDLDPSTPLSVQAVECLCELSHDDTAAHEAIKCDTSSLGLSVSSV